MIMKIRMIKTIMVLVIILVQLMGRSLQTKPKGVTLVVEMAIIMDKVDRLIILTRMVAHRVILEAIIKIVEVVVLIILAQIKTTIKVIILQMATHILEGILERNILC